MHFSDNATPVFLSEEFHGQRSLVGYRPWGHKESDTLQDSRTKRKKKKHYMYKFLIKLKSLNKGWQLPSFYK